MTEHHIKNIAIIGSSGAIGRALMQQCSKQYPQAQLHGFSRNSDNIIDYSDEQSIQAAADFAARQAPLDIVIVTNGILHDDDFMPEKSLKDLSAEKFQRVFLANTITPALIAKYFIPKLSREQPAKFAALSARVGSISDNRLGGWYSYRSSKAALNMVIKNAAIETTRTHKHAAVVSLHPGTVDSALSQPFQDSVPNGKLFSPAYAAENLLHVLGSLTASETGKCFAWDGQEITP